MSTLGDPLPPPLSTFVNFWRPPPPAPWVDVNKVRSLMSSSNDVVHYVYEYQSQNRKGREILPSLSYHSNEYNRQRHHFILKMEDDILRSVTYGGH